MQNMEIRDKRERGWFYMDNEYLNGYAKILGGNCTLTYLSLCRHANESDQTCFPQMRTIAEENKISVKSVERAIKTLQDWNIIAVEKRRNEKTNRQMSNLYTLLSKRVWKEKPTDTKSHGELADRQINDEPTDKSRQTPVLHNNTNNNKTQYNNTIADTSADKLIPEIIKEMEKIDIKNKTYYGNKTQREASKFLIENYGFEQVVNMISIIAENRHKIFNVPTSPVMLRDNWVRIISEQGYKAYQLKSKKPQVLYV